MDNILSPGHAKAWWTEERGYIITLPLPLPSREGSKPRHPVIRNLCAALCSLWFKPKLKLFSVSSVTLW